MAVPELLPANFIDCKNKKDAKKAVLIYNSHYADIQKEELFDFVKEFDFDELNFEIDINGIEFEKKEKSKIKNEQLVPYEKTHILLSFHPDKIIEINDVIEKLEKINGVEIEKSSN